MALDPIKLDDLTWADMVSAVRARIATTSNRAWTLHAPVDPGVTLLELYAYLFEQRLFWMDQDVPALTRAGAALLHERPRDAVPAQTVLCFRDGNAFRQVDALTRLSVDAAGGRRVFSTRHSVIVLPLATTSRRGRATPIGFVPPSLDVRAGGIFRGDDLRQQRAVRLFSLDDTPAKVDVFLPLNCPISGLPPKSTMTLWFDLYAPDVTPQWNPAAPRHIDAPTPIHWQYRVYPGNDDTAFTDFPAVYDGTAGLRRGGVVRLTIPPNWQAEASSTTYVVRLRLDRPSDFTYPPRLRRVLANVCMAANVEVVRRPISLGEWPRLPGRTVSLDHLAADAVSRPLHGGGSIRLRERADNAVHVWRPRLDLSAATPTDRVYTFDRDLATCTFGDGYHGRVPVRANAPNEVDVQFISGGGTAGNTAERREWTEVVDAEKDWPAPLAAVNVVPAIGGAEAETVDALRRRVRTSLRRRTRVVTPADAAAIARATPGVSVARVHAAAGVHPRFARTAVPGVITVYVVPAAPRETDDFDTTSGEHTNTDDWADEPLIAPVDSAFVAAPIPDAAVLRAIARRLDRARLIGSQIFVRGPDYRAVHLRLTIAGASAGRDRLLRQLRGGLGKLFDPLVGGPDQTGWPFDERIRPSQLLHEAQKILGDLGTATELAVCLVPRCGPANWESCVEVDLGTGVLPVLGRVDLTIDAAPRPASGGMR